MLLSLASILYLVTLSISQSASSPPPSPDISPTPQPLALKSPCHSGRSLNPISNDLLLQKQCRPLTLLFARGSQEIGNMGTRVGPALARALKALLGPDQVTVQGVNNYPAILYEALHGVGSVSGSRWLAEAISVAKRRCPGTYLVVSGYSQGAMLVHNAARNISTYPTYVSQDLTSFVKSVALFGDPDRGTSLGSIHTVAIEICFDGDGYCQHNGSEPPYPAHISYCRAVPRVAKMIVQQSGLSLTNVSCEWCEKE